MTTASVRLRLDTSQAQAELQRFVGEARGAAGQMGKSVRRGAFRGGAMGGAMGGLAGRMLGGRGGLPGSLGALSAMGSTGDILKAMFGQLGGQMDKFVYGDKGPEARAAMRAQDDIVKSMALATGLSGSIPPAAKDIFDARRQIFEAEEKGAQMIRTSKDFNPESINSKVEAIIERGVTSFVGRLFGYMAGNTFNSK